MSAVTVTTPIRKNSGWRLFLQTVIGRAYPRVIGQQREKSWLIFEVLLPLINVAAYVYVYRAIGAPEDYVGFVVIGGAMIAFWMNVLWSMSSQLYWEKEQGNLALYIIAPTSLMAILLGMAIGGMIATLLRAGAIIALGTLLFNVHYVIINPWQLLAVFALTMIALYGLGMMTASVFLLFSREAWHYVNLAMEPVYLLSGFYFPLKNLGFWVALGASVIPLSLGLDAMRQLAFRSGPSLGFLSVPLEIAILAVLSVIFLIAARWLLATLERLAREEARLTENRR
ncbi:MAG: ABC transporter permease [Thermanaerothrix sp.]|uniref:Transport permease protein n=2 Tax=Thermanaerothrix TaxID=1077886 RepID=A0ABU3NPX9_9CHLR|nr:ABC transporter permease [Thermanaerothrix sp. 4228-RoL]MDT8898905.1 ABC transporter permease [Thermanaerothrix sp. 4228-RoL]